MEAWRSIRFWHSTCAAWCLVACSGGEVATGDADRERPIDPEGRAEREEAEPEVTPGQVPGMESESESQSELGGAGGQSFSESAGGGAPPLDPVAAPQENGPSSDPNPTPGEPEATIPAEGEPTVPGTEAIEPPDCELPVNQWVQIGADGLDWPVQSTAVNAQGAWADGALWLQIVLGPLWRFDPCENTWTEVAAEEAPGDLAWQARYPVGRDPVYDAELSEDGFTTTVRAVLIGSRYRFVWGSHTQTSEPPDYETSRSFLEGGEVLDPEGDAVWSRVSLTNAPAPRFYPMLAELGERILVTGGFEEWDPSLGGTGLVQESAARGAAIYDPATDEWTPIADAPVLQNPRLPSSTTFPVSHWNDGRLLLFDYDGGGIYTEATDTWVATETTAGVSAPGYFLSGERYVDFGNAPRVLNLESGVWTALPSEAEGFAVDPNQSYGWSIQVWSGRTFFRFGYYLEPVCTESACEPAVRVAGGAMFTVSE